MDDLDYEKHLEHYKNLLGYYVDNPHTNKEQTLACAEKKAQTIHSLCVLDSINNLSTKSFEIVQKLKNDDAKYYMKYGVGRRSLMLYYSYQAIINIACPERTEPLSCNEQIDLSREINILYINLRGILDNYAWCFMYEQTPNLKKELHLRKISLFSKDFRKKCSAFHKIKKGILAHDTWEKEVKERRDPVAHRIPLYVPHTIMTSNETERYSNSNIQYNEKLNNLDLEGANQLFNEMYRMGTFYPVFIHHHDDGLIPIYPTIPTDLVHLIRIQSVVESGLFS